MILTLPVLSGIMFGSAGVFVRTLTAAGVGNFSVMFLRSAIAVLEMTVFLLVYDRSLFKVRLKDLPVFLGTGILSMTCLNFCYNMAVNRLSLSLAAVLLSTAPVFVIAAAAVLFGERITRRKVICVALAIFGCVLSSGLAEEGAGASLSASGVILGLLSAVFYALYSVFSKMATDRGYHTYTVIFYTVVFYAIVMIPFADYGQIAEFVSLSPLSNIVFLLLHSLMLSILPYVLITVALQYAEAGRVSIFASSTETISAAVFGVFVYQEIPTVLMAFGMMTVIAALVVLSIEPVKV